jgi:hypothetical protein
MCEIQILNLIKCRSGIFNQCDQRLFLFASRFFRLAKKPLVQRLWILEVNQVTRVLKTEFLISIFNRLNSYT